ncbi:TraM recognition domain-containing protein [Ottowia sp.]|uniref:type IV secretory system conjugative DNA transfer family protein n=1 Tax=Ottowia sp. TaxID=1898956 RepID=UPI0025D3AA11|nr:TraM recognition domain-containing protein [Ottowia sp.]MBK6616118.1 TraM recognition domain-containing protein [Ottowia sp.]
MKSKAILDSFYGLRLGGTQDTIFLLLLVAAGLGTSPFIVGRVNPIFIAVLALISLSYFTYRVLSPFVSQHLLRSGIDIKSHASPIGPSAEPNGFLIGYSTDTGEPIYVQDEYAVRHFFIVGQSGVGKSVLGLLLMFQQIMRGGGLLFIDGKLDSDNIRQIWYYCQMAGRPHDFQVINPGDPDSSNTYNPILYGDPDEVASRILSLIPSTQNNPGADHYKQEANQGIATLVSALQRAGLAYNMIDLSILLTNANALLELEKKLSSTQGASTSEELKNYSLFLDKFRVPDQRTGQLGIDIKRMKDTFGGIGGRLYMFGTGKFGRVMNTYDPDVKMFESMLSNKVIYVALPTMGKNEAANNFGKMVIGDLRTAISWIQELPEKDRPNPAFLVFMDEQGSYATESLMRPYEQARSARIILCGAVQTLANLDVVSEEFAEIVKGTTWTKLYFKLGTQETAVECAELIGMHMGIIKSLSDTTNTSSSANFLRATPESSNAQGSGTSVGEREQEAYRVSPDDLKALQTGEAVMTYGGYHLYNIRVPRILVTADAEKQFGEIIITRRPPREVTGADFFGSTERFLAASNNYAASANA